MVSLAELKRRAVRLDGQRLETGAKGRGFRLHLGEEGPVYVPESSGEPRGDTWDRISTVLDRFNKTGSVRPGDYQDVTRHASYVMAVIQAVFPETIPQPHVSAVSGVVEEEPKAPTGEKSHQRVGAESNAHVGRDFERVAFGFFLTQGTELGPVNTI